MFAAFSYAAYVSVNSVDANQTVIEKVEDEPKTKKAKADKDKSKDATAKSEKKAECSKKKASSCAKSCSGK